MPKRDEPFGHRGHPAEFEVKRASRVADRLEGAVERLEAGGFSREEAVAFIAGIAAERAASRLWESWSNPANARLTVAGLLEGKSAKDWSLDAVQLALTEVENLLA
jgi:hypothetical protein